MMNSREARATVAFITVDADALVAEVIDVVDGAVVGAVVYDDDVPVAIALGLDAFNALFKLIYAIIGGNNDANFWHDFPLLFYR